MYKSRVLVVDDHVMLREALCDAINAEADLQVVGFAVNGDQAVQQAISLNPDVIVMDLLLPGKDGVSAITEIILNNPKARILAITSSLDNQMVVAAVKEGAMGYLLKDESRAVFLQGLREVAHGNIFLPPESAIRLARGVRSQQQMHTSPTQTEPLTPREQDVLKLMGEGLSNRAIASQLSLSMSTVRVHVFNLLRKLNFEERGQAVIYAVKHKSPQ